MSQPTRDYNRPTQLWQCEVNCHGPLGPSRWGRCRNTPPCRPRLSLRGQRGVFVLTCMFATLGLLAIALFPGWRNVVVHPGPLSHAHGQALAEIATADRCASCHDAADADPIAWLAIASGKIHTLAAGQATRCLNCHEQSLGRELALVAHNVPREALAETTRRITGDMQLTDLVRVKLASKGDVACATCHREHHGIHANLTELTDQQCQACHVQAFESFAHGHPEFRRTLPPRRSRIAFDHVSHQDKHFPTKQTAWSCSQCHEDDAPRDVKRLVGFERSCAQCHTQPIEAASQEGLLAFSFPTLDVDRLRAAGHDIGSWPAAAKGDFDGAIPPAVRMLLMADDEAALVLEMLGSEFDFTQAKPNEQTEALAWSYKRLLNDLAEDSAATIRGRLEKVAGEKLPEQRLQLILRQLPPALLREARNRWLPEVGRELAERGVRPSGITAANTIYPQVRSELLAENPLASGKSTEKPAVPGITWWSKGERASENENVRLSPQVTPSHPSPLPGVSERSNQGELLVVNPLAKTTHQTVGPSPEPTPVEETLQTAGPMATITPPGPEPSSIPPLNPSDLAAAGTWYLDDATLSVRYRPRGHADELLRLLIDVAAQSTTHHVPHAGLLPTVLANQALGSCASCHSIDTYGQNYSINWRAVPRDASRRHFTEFSHRPHLLQPQLGDCRHCHVINAASNVLSNYDSTDPMAHAHDFQPITKSNCISCHTTSSQGGRCTMCHSYHVGTLKGLGK